MRHTLLILEVLPGIAGGQRALIETLPALADFTLHAVIPGPGPLAEALSGAGVVCHELPMEQYTLVKKTGRDVLSAGHDLAVLPPRVSRLAREVGADLLYANSTRAFTWGTLAARRAGLPIIWHARNMLMDGKTLMLTRLLARLTCVEQILCTCPQAGLQFGQPTKTRTVRLGVDLARFQPSVDQRSATRRALEVDERAFVVLQVGDLIELKGQELLIEAARLGPEDILYLVAGGPRQQDPASLAYASRLQQQAGKNVRLLGPRDDVPLLLNAADLLVVLSQQETGPSALLEAMASGKPVLSTPVGLAPELVMPGITGEILDRREPELLAERIQELASHPEHVAAMGRQARELAERELGLEAYQQRILQAIEGTLDPRP